MCAESEGGETCGQRYYKGKFFLKIFLCFGLAILAEVYAV